jgi:hypothetical protein
MVYEILGLLMQLTAKPIYTLSARGSLSVLGVPVEGTLRVHSHLHARSTPGNHDEHERGREKRENGGL